MSRFFNNTKSNNQLYIYAKELRKAELRGAQVTFKNDMKWIYPMIAVAMHNAGMQKDTIEDILQEANNLTEEWGKSDSTETAAEMCERITGITFEMKDGD